MEKHAVSSSEWLKWSNEIINVNAIIYSIHVYEIALNNKLRGNIHVFRLDYFPLVLEGTHCQKIPY